MSWQEVALIAIGVYAALALIGWAIVVWLIKR